MKKRNITEFQILSEIVRKQPHVKQKEIADALDITIQAVSEHMRNLLKKGYIKSRGRGEYIITDKGMRVLKNWISEFKRYLDDVTQDLYKYKDVWPAIANEDLNEGDEVYLFMRKGLLYASKEIKTDAKGKILEGGRKGEDVAICDIRGIIDVPRGRVTIIKIPPRIKGGSKNTNYELIKKVFEDNEDLVIATMGTVANVVASKMGLHSDIRFAVSEGIVAACNRGCDVLALITGKMTEKVVRVLDKHKIGYTVLDATKED